MESSQARMMTLVRLLRDCCLRKEDELCRHLSLNNSQYACLLVFPPSESITVGDLSRLMELSPSRTSRIADNLVRRGFLSRRIPDSDRRSQLLKLAPAGRKVKEAIEQLSIECERRLLDSLSAERVSQAREGIEALIQAFQMQSSRR